jgi:hypothetical protein
MNILEQANEIVFKREGKKEQQYGPFSEGMDKTAKIASLLSNKEITKNDCYNVMIALKLAREAHCHKEDNILDAIAYMAQRNQDLEEEALLNYTGMNLTGCGSSVTPAGVAKEWQLCPKCLGKGFHSPDVLGTSATELCVVCHGNQIIKKP